MREEGDRGEGTEGTYRGERDGRGREGEMRTKEAGMLMRKKREAGGEE